jgi:hypothetical protein
MATKMRGLALTLWVVTMGCFASGWLSTNRVAIAAGCATLVLYIVVGGRARSLSLSSKHKDADARVITK